MENKISIYGIGNPLMDFVVNVDYVFLKELGIPAGTMKLIEEGMAGELLSKIDNFKNVPGGSCANTIRGIAWLAKYKSIEKVAYNGSVGLDDTGKKYISMMRDDYNILPVICRKDKKTGLSIVIVTPDYERTMLTFLGACDEFSEYDLDFKSLIKAKILHFTGYLWSSENQKKAIKKAVEFVKNHGIKVSFDIADPVVVKLHKDEFLSWIPGNVDYLFGNKEEIKMLMGFEGEEVDLLSKASFLADVVIMKSGAKGCTISHGGDLFLTDGIKVNAIDTVGAGDSFASGFLYGLLQRKELQICSKIANKLAAQIVTVVGCNYEKLEQEKILKEFL